MVDEGMGLVFVDEYCGGYLISVAEYNGGHLLYGSDHEGYIAGFSHEQLGDLEPFFYIKRSNNILKSKIDVMELMKSVNISKGDIVEAAKNLGWKNIY